HLSEDGYVYGRGSQDMKGHMIALLEAVEYHLSNGKMFERDLYLCFGHDEEPGTSTEGASNIVKHLKESGAQVEFVVDEGGTVLDGKCLGSPTRLLSSVQQKKAMATLKLWSTNLAVTLQTPILPRQTASLQMQFARLKRIL
ncbi:MAG: M20/M25/M40 family metallo-hydrolase, partial [Clostridia bacterium]|nr:M20/M25/M40 family metallo-hydrolase [Clostridia bacterium]